MLIRSLGKNPSGDLLTRIQKSPHYKGNVFQNLIPTDVMLPDASYLKMMNDFVSNRKIASPQKLIPAIQTDLKNLASDKLVIVWFGHSSYLIRYRNKTILVDPVLDGQASPVSLFGKAFKGTNLYRVADLPPLDVVIITHDHYDHLDYATIAALNSQQVKFYTPLGVGSHLAHWGIPAAAITEMDWWESQQVDEHMHLTATPARHFSGRGLARNKTLWASYVLTLYDTRILIGGDSGYGNHFKEIGDRYSPFDLAILEAGQYGESWPHIHMFPEQTVQATIDLQAKALLPVHWGKFALAYHAWNEPIQRVIKEANKLQVPVIVPQIGKPLTLDVPMIKMEDSWWEK